MKTRRVSKSLLVQFLKFVDNAPHDSRWTNFAQWTIPGDERERLAAAFLEKLEENKHATEQPTRRAS